MTCVIDKVATRRSPDEETKEKFFQIPQIISTLRAKISFPSKYFINRPQPVALEEEEEPMEQTSSRLIKLKIVSNLNNICEFQLKKKHKLHITKTTKVLL